MEVAFFAQWKNAGLVSEMKGFELLSRTSGGLSKSATLVKKSFGLSANCADSDQVMPGAATFARTHYWLRIGSKIGHKNSPVSGPSTLTLFGGMLAMVVLSQGAISNAATRPSQE